MIKESDIVKYDNFPNKLVSVIIPAYNAELYLEECVQSVMDQSYANIEIIIVNDGSYDGTKDIAVKLAQRDNRVVFVDKVNEGVSSARNAGLTVARGDFVLFLDADDKLNLDACKITVEKAICTNSDIIFFDCIRFFCDGTSVPVYAFTSDEMLWTKEKKDFFIYDMKVSTVWGKLYKRNIIDGLMFDEKIVLSEDVEYNYRLFPRVKKATYLRKPLLYYRVQNQSAVHGYDPNTEKKFSASINAINLLINREDEDTIHAYYSFVAIAFLVICQNQICKNRAISFLRKISEIKELSSKKWAVELFQNYNEIRLPKSRKLLVWFGKKHLYFIVYFIIAVKCRRGR